MAQRTWTTDELRAIPFDESKLVRSNGQVTHSLSIQEPNIQTYVDLRRWCHVNNLHFSDLINSLLPAVSYYCLNFARRDAQDRVTITMNIGDITITQVHHAVHNPVTTTGRPRKIDPLGPWYKNKKKYNMNRRSKNVITLI